MKRTFETPARSTPSTLSVTVPKADRQAARHEPVIAKNSPSIEPSLLISIPIIASSIKQGLIEDEGLILVKKEGSPSSVYLKKPLDILKDRDVEGLKNISRIIGTKHIEAFLKKEGVELPDRSLSFDAMLGKGYSVDKKVLTAMYNRHVGKNFDPVMPFSAAGFEVKKTADTFEINRVGEIKQVQKAQGSTGWTMPDLTGLSMKAALDMVAPKAHAVKVYGSGIITDQYPKPQEQVKSDTECALYGRSHQR